ncbi:MAG TPA: hypothetical protein VFQ61_29495 [Polyangiaceae bacterium]|nr:hypothetical protein [Polyangiaceae bacterium]
MSFRLVISGVGAVSSVGAGALQTCASIRAGLSGLREHPDFYPQPPNPVIEPPERVSAGLVPLGLSLAARRERMLELAARAAHELITLAPMARGETERTELVLCVASAAQGGFDAAEASELTSALGQRLGLQLERPLRTISQGATGVLRAVGEARTRIAAGEVARVIVVGVESWVTLDALAALDEARRLRSARILDGLIAAEAAACVLLENAENAQARGRTALAEFASVGFGREPNTLEGELNSSGVGLTEAVRAATRSFGRSNWPWLLSDMTGESYGAYELGLLRARLGEQLGSTEVWHPADCTGAAGTGSAALGLVIAARALADGYAPADRVLLCVGAQGEERAAGTLLACTQPGRRE